MIRSNFCILLFLFFTAGKAYSQNAYYDARYIARWLDSSKITEEGIDSIRIKVFSYSSKDTSWVAFRQYPILDKVYKKIEDLFFQNTPDSLVKAMIKLKLIGLYRKNNSSDKDTVILNAIQTKMDSIEKIYDEISKLDKFIKARNVLSYDDLSALQTSFLNRLKDSSDLRQSFVDRYFNRLVSIKWLADSLKAPGDSALMKTNLYGFATANEFGVGDSLFVYARDTLFVDSAKLALEKEATLTGASKGLAIDVIDILNKNLQLRGYVVNECWTTFYRSAFIPDLTADNRESQQDLNSKIKQMTTAPTVILNNINVQSTTIQAEQQATGLSNPHTISSTELIDQVAILMVNRFKQEVSLTFIDWVRKKLNSSEILRDLFPATLHQLNNTEAFELPRFGKVWANVLAQDFSNLPENLAKSQYVRSRIDNSRFRSQLPELNIFIDLVTIANAASQQIALPDIVNFYKNGQITLQSEYSQTIFNTLDLINTELSDKDSAKYWLNWQNVQKMSRKQWEVFCALVQVKYQSTVFDRLSFALKDQAILQANLKKYLIRAVNILNSFEANVTTFNKQLQTNSNAKYSGINFWDLQNFLFTGLLDSSVIKLNARASHIIWLTQQGLKIYKLREQKDMAGMLHASFELLDSLLPGYNNRLSNILVRQWKLDGWQSEHRLDTLESKLNELSGFFDYARNQRKILKGEDLLNDLYIRYKVMVDSTKVKPRPANVKILFRLVARDFLDRTIDYKDLLVVDKDSILGNVLYNNYLNDSNGLSVIIAQPSRFLAISKAAEFLTDLLTAKNNKEISEIISSYSMPANSYKIKRNSRFSWDINGYIGAYGGLEFIRESSNKPGKLTTLSGAFVYGFSAPIGVTYSYGKTYRSNVATPGTFLKPDGKLRNLRGNCTSITLTFFDLGAVVSYRVANGQNGSLPQQVKWGQLFSPGIHIREGIRNTPICLSEGIQLTPQLRNLSSSGSVDQKQAWRLYIGAFFDIPFFNIAHR